MFTFIPEDGTGLPTANSYLSVASADDYFAARLYSTAWTAASNSDKEKALCLASLLIDSQVRFLGGKKNQSQGLQWPRVNCPDPDFNEESDSALSDDQEGTLPSNAVPKFIKDATCEMAKEMLTADRTVTENEGINQISVPGAVHLQFLARDRRPILSRVVIALLSKYGEIISNSSGSARLVRT